MILKSCLKVFSLLLILMSLLLPSPANSDVKEKESEGILNRLLAPGPLMSGHKNLEGKDCLKCHDAGKGISQEKCLDCHKPIKLQMNAGTGYHGLMKQSCIDCHSDHKGRDFDSVKVNLKTFDHKLTGYNLEGKHATLKCSECHTEKRSEKFIRKQDISFVGAKSSCVSCHKKDDVHAFKGEYAKKDCAVCHSLKSWKQEVKFNHEKDTHYKLEGKHAEMKCADCHGPNSKKPLSQYKWPIAKSQCMACHADFHKKNLSPQFAGGKCQACHDQKTWKLPDFDHSVTKYPLREKHAELKCEECHKQSPKVLASGLKNFKFTGLKSDCLSCHKDYHRFGERKSVKLGKLNQCLSCHNERSWDKIHNFEHSTSTRYVIDGKHNELKCEECHLIKQNPKSKTSAVSPVYHWDKLNEKTCENCHASPHAKSFTKDLLKKRCTECHLTEGWTVFKKDGKHFDHSATRFALSGKHSSIACKDCHVIDKKQVFKFKHFEGQFCIDCHKSQHEKQFSPKFSTTACFQCHTSKNFTELKVFDHNQTRYPLKASHMNLKCSECHTPTSQMFTGKNPHAMGKFLFPELMIKSCSTCHSDYHKAQLGLDCAKCHTEDKWKKTIFEHNKQSSFQLSGAHVTTKCESCHKDLVGQKVEFSKKIYSVVQYKPLKSECASCHSDFHKGQLGNECNACHTTEKWKPTIFDHNKQSRFKVEGKHKDLNCIKCHLVERGQTVKFQSKEFKVVHYKPLAPQCLACHKDPHKSNFGNKCEECHVDRGWRITKDFHKNFTLSGVHFTLSCNECHTNNRRLAGLSQDCLFCHQKDDIHKGSLPNCKDCHRQQFWENTEFKHSLSRFPLTGAHRTIDCASCHFRGIYQGTPSICGSCHLQDALAVSSPRHAAFPSLNNCGQCHTTFTFSIAK
jgi:hypothetical protein